MYSGREQRRPGIDAGGPLPQYRMSLALGRGRPFNCGKGASPGQLNMVGAAAGRDPGQAWRPPQARECLLVRRESCRPG